MKTKIMFFVLLVLSATVSAQSGYEIKSALDFYRINNLTKGEWGSDMDQSEIEGSPYLEDDFVKGTIYTTQKERYIDVPMRYNIYNDEIEFKNSDGKILALAAPDLVEKIEIGKQSLFYMPYFLAKKMKRGFFELISDGKASLYIKHRVILQKPEKPAAYKEAVPAKFVKDKDEFYIRVGMEAAMEVGNKKDLVDIFPNNKDKIEAFIKKHKIKTNKAESLTELVNYYNSL